MDWVGKYEYDLVKKYHYGEGREDKFNELPENCKPIDEKKFAQYIGYGYGWVAIDLRQPRRYGKDELNGVKIDSARLFFFEDGSGFGVGIDYDGNPHYFEFYPCEHDFELVWARGFEKKYKCRKCGFERYIDTSD